MVIAGEASSIYIPELPRSREGAQRLRGLRLLHTHLGSETLSREDLMDMLFLRLDAAIELNVGQAGEPLQWQAAWLLPGKTQGEPYVVDAVHPWHDADFDLAALAQSLEDEFARLYAAANPESGAGRALLVSVSTEPRIIQERNLEELAQLAATAGLETAGRLIQRVARPNPRFILGKGKLAELEVMALNSNASILVFDGELSPAQLHNLADITERKVLDRTQLILDIFAQHAVTKAGKLQVELAQLAYAQPRLAGRNHAFDRLMGGIGGRGPGESKLETDRRRSRERMSFLRRELEKLRRQRAFARQRRRRNDIPVAALVGYTNAGKSTLLNALTKSSVLSANQLFATLDPITRRFRFPHEREITLADTVGFIRNLPQELMEAFRATLEELESADLLLHVADASHPDLVLQLEAVEKILEELELAGIARKLVFNKCDLAEPEALANLKDSYSGAIFVSAATGAGLETLLECVESEIFAQKVESHPDVEIMQ